jgi:transposase
MKRCHFIGMDVHCQFCELVMVNSGGEVCHRQRCDTNIPALREVIEAVKQPRLLVFEEGPLADWLSRNLAPVVDKVVVSEPRRNRLIAQDGDKDDPVDAEKLAQLLRGGFVKEVHQSQDLSRSLFKQQVSVYHDRVRHRVAEGLRVASLFRRHGVMIREKHFVAGEDRPALLQRLPDDAGLRSVLECLWKGYDQAVEQEELLRRRLVALAKQEEVVCRFQELPGMGPVRAATFFVYVDTPWRFTSKQALWKYLGIGLERRRSGNGPEWLRVPLQINRLLKDTILGAAMSAAIQGDNPFADQHRRWLEQGLTRRLARRNVARSLAATLWGLWKNGSVYHPEWVGVAAAAGDAARPSR